jgi:hypothetical protein
MVTHSVLLKQPHLPLTAPVHVKLPLHCPERDGSHVAVLHVWEKKLHVPLGQSVLALQPHLPSVAPLQVPLPVEHSLFE